MSAIVVAASGSPVRLSVMSAGCLSCMVLGRGPDYHSNSVGMVLGTSSALAREVAVMLSCMVLAVISSVSMSGGSASSAALWWLCLVLGCWVSGASDLAPTSLSGALVAIAGPGPSTMSNWLLSDSCILPASALTV